MTNVSPELARRLNAMLATFVGREPRWRYNQHTDGAMFFWTVERYDDDADHKHAGLYVSGAYARAARGSRSGTATSFRLADASVSGHRSRKDARARARRLYRAHRAGERRPWA